MLIFGDSELEGPLQQAERGLGSPVEGVDQHSHSLLQLATVLVVSLETTVDANLLHESSSGEGGTA